MTKATSLPVLVCLAAAVSGCSSISGMFHKPGSSAEFVAGNSSQVLIDIRHGPDTELAAARQLANDKCTLFGKSSAVLQSINPHGDNVDRVQFACQ